MSYIDGMVAAVPTANKDAYIAHASKAAVIFKKHGALSVVDCWGDDVPEGKINSFHTAVDRKEDETIVFSWISWPDKATHDTGMQNAMIEMTETMSDMPMPFDGKRMIFGSFDVISET
ncbi:DUF1428 domain-containing protein [Hirschia litorea]|uniref:DUF1428 domain-containing protein n=1 Tax=Hirschia litorea TaxID=1199156 RepID=A0ABW2IM90_9PROT